MRRRVSRARLPAIALVLLALPARPGDDAGTPGGTRVQLDHAVLLQPDRMLAERVKTPELGKYVKAVRKAAEDWLATQLPADADGVSVIMGVKPGGKTRAWTEAAGHELPPALLRALEAELARVPALHVENGPITFVLHFRAAGHFPTFSPAQRMPPPWQRELDAIKGPKPASLLLPDGVFAYIWP